jgi:cell volume regulation protein A
MREIGIANGNTIVGKKIVDIEFPKTAIIAMIKRDDKYITPNGNTVINADDVLIVLSESEKGIKKVFKALKIQEFSAA